MAALGGRRCLARRVAVCSQVAESCGPPGLGPLEGLPAAGAVTAPEGFVAPSPGRRRRYLTLEGPDTVAARFTPLGSTRRGRS